MLDQQRYAGARNIIEPDVHRIKSGLGKLQLLDAGREIAGDKVQVFRKCNLKRDLGKVRHDAATVGIDEIDRQLVVAFVAGHERYAHRHRTLRMDCRTLWGGQQRRDDGVECPQQA